MTKAKKIISLAAGVALTMLMASCGSTKAMYKWYDYDKASYNYTKAPTDENLEKLLVQYEKIVNEQTNTLRETCPPGICADYGYALIKSGKEAQGQELLAKELELYPESKVLIERIKKMMNKGGR